MALLPIGIRPTIDCVFKALLGDPAHKRVLLDFLRAVLGAEAQIVDVTIENPFSMADLVNDKLNIVDIRAKTADGRILQIEMQTCNEAALKERILFAWAKLFQQQLREGDNYNALQPVISIWLLEENTVPRSPNFHNRFLLFDPATRICLLPHLEIHLIELERWKKTRQPTSPALEGWLRFFTEADTWPEIPTPIATPALEEAMSILSHFQQNEEMHLAYQARLDAQRRQRTQQEALERARRGEQEALARAEEAEQLASEASGRALEEIHLREAAEAKAQMAEAQAQAERARAERLAERLKALGLSEG